jgi:hypothetical protein
MMKVRYFSLKKKDLVKTPDNPEASIPGIIAAYKRNA